MKGLTFVDKEHLEIKDFPLPHIQLPTDVIVKITYASICTSDIHILKDKVPRAKKGTILGHEGVGIITEVGKEIKKFKVGEHVSINCITFCGECFFCKNGYINNCDKGGWELGCRINGTLANYVRIPFADSSLNIIPTGLPDESCLFVGDALSSGFFGTELGNIKENDLVAVIGCGPVGLCTLLCCKMKGAKTVVFDINEKCLDFAKKYNLADAYINPNNLNMSSNEDIIESLSTIDERIRIQKGFDCTIEVAGSDESFQMAWKITRANGIVAIVAMYEKDQVFKLPLMYGKNLTFKTGGVDAIHCDELIKNIKEGKLNTDCLITQRFEFKDVAKAFDIFRNKPEHCVKISIKL